MLHGHGDDGYLFSREIIADFSTNVWYGGEPEGLKEHLFNHWKSINKYPEVLGEGLIKKISEHHHLSPDNILINNGSIESIYSIAQAFKKNKTTIAVPAFAEYEDACKMYGHELKFIEWENLDSSVQLNTDVFFLCNPNNPTGEVFSNLEELISNNPETVFVIDEAFIEFTLATETFIPLINKYPNLIILRSLTKAYAIPGLRLGYIVASSLLIAKLKSFKYPWSVNTLALEAGKFIFDNFDNIKIPLGQLFKEKERFVNEAEKTGIKTYKSHTHFFLAETPKGTASELKKFLIHNFGVLIRDASNFRSLSPQHLRVATLSTEKNDLLIKALKEWLNHNC